MYPHERSLVKRYEGRPFAWLGINSDLDRETAQAVMAQEQLNCRCWWDGGPDGPIDAQYHIEGWPAIYVLDAQGIIRYAQVQGPNLERAIETLLQELERGRRS